MIVIFFMLVFEESSFMLRKSELKNAHKEQGDIVESHPQLPQPPTIEEFLPSPSTYFHDLRTIVHLISNKYFAFHNLLNNQLVYLPIQK